MLSVQQEKESPGSVSSCGAKHVRTSWTELTVVKQQQGVVWSEISIPHPGIEPGQPGWRPGILDARPARARS